MKRYIDVDEFKLPCTAGDCHECIFFSLNRCIMKEHINNSVTITDVVEITDKRMIPLIKYFVKDLEKLGGAVLNDASRV